MGLEVWVYSGLTKADNVEVDRDGYPREWDRFWRVEAPVKYTECIFPGRSAWLEQDAIYAFTGYAEFNAGTTKTYRAWRDTLGALAGYENIKGAWRTPPPLGAPFGELIYFHDCGGVLGPVVAAKLAQDFSAFRQRAENLGGAFFDLYSKWQRAFEMTAGTGALRFASALDDDQACRVCGCSDVNPVCMNKTGLPCFWTEEDLCSGCWKPD
jgi:hypothetical protein